MSLPSPSEIVKDTKASGTAGGMAQHAEKPHTPTPSEITKDRGRPHTEHAQKEILPGEWVQRILQEREKAENGGNDQNERGRGRSLPDEQREKDKGRDR